MNDLVGAATHERGANPRVGIVTMPIGCNYGNLLQKYASEQVWRKAGFESWTLDRPDIWGAQGWPPRVRVKRSYRALRHSIGDVLRALGVKKQKEHGVRTSAARIEAFNRFQACMHVVPYGKDIPAELGSDYDLFSAGSDQSWNPRFMHTPNWNFLRFAPVEKRVALCPSIGISEIGSDDAYVLARGLAGFAELSVREESGAAIIRRLAGRQATVLADPTLMLTPAEWRAVADGRLTPAGPYVFAYLLGDESLQRAQALGALADGRQVIQISDHDDGTELPAGPAEFIDLVDHAALVVTDSFHACVFAALLAAPLVAVPRAGGEGMSGRIDTLADKLGLARQPIEGVAYPAERLVPGADLDARLAAERQKFAAYLHGVLESRGFERQARLAWAACNAVAPEGAGLEVAVGGAEAAEPAPEAKEQAVTDVQKSRERERVVLAELELASVLCLQRAARRDAAAPCVLVPLSPHDAERAVQRPELRVVSCSRPERQTPGRRAA